MLNTNTGQLRDHQFTAQEKANLGGQLKQFQSVLLKRNGVTVSG